MINVKITMVDSTEYNVRNIATNIEDFRKRVIAPWSTDLHFVEIVKGNLINVDNIIGMREMSDEEVDKLNKPEVEKIVGLAETEVKVEGLETELPEVSQ